MAANDHRQLRCTAMTAPRATPITEPNEPPEMNAPLREACTRGANTLSTTAIPTLP